MNTQTLSAVEQFLARGGQIKALPVAKKSEIKWNKFLKDQKVKEIAHAS